MSIEKVIRILQPLIPGQARIWQQTRELASPETRARLDKHILHTAYRRLGDFTQKILLSLPPAAKARGTYQLGTVVYDVEKWPVGISSRELTQNLAILGRSGAGKTNVSFHLLGQLIDHKIPVLFLDWKRSVRHLIPHFPQRLAVYTPGRSIAPFPFNPFMVPPGIEPTVYVNQVVDVMSQAFTLGEGSRSLIRKTLAALYDRGHLGPTVKELIRDLEALPEKGRIAGWKLTALRALESLEFAALSTDDQVSQDQLTRQLLNGFTVVELDALAQESKKFLIPMLCLWLYYVRLSQPEREELKLVIFIEEAHHILHKHPQTSGETIIEMLLRQCRELGIGIVVIDQHPHLLSAAALGNTYTTIFLNQKDPADINKAAAVCLLDAEDKSWFSRLPTGSGIVKLQDRWMQPFLVRFPHFQHQKGAVTDARLARYFALHQARGSHQPSQPTGSGRKTSLPADFAPVPRSPRYDTPLSTEAFHLLEDILRYPDDGVKTRYRRLKLGVGSGNRLKEQLLRLGWLESQAIQTGRIRTVLLRLTRSARTALALDPPQEIRESIAHAYWKRYYAQRFRELGYQVRLEANRPVGRTDLVAQQKQKTIALEVETGQSDYLKNLRQNLQAHFTRIIIVATSPTAYHAIEKRLAQLGLLLPPRITLIQCGESFQPECGLSDSTPEY